VDRFSPSSVRTHLWLDDPSGLIVAWLIGPPSFASLTASCEESPAIVVKQMLRLLSAETTRDDAPNRPVAQDTDVWLETLDAGLRKKAQAHAFESLPVTRSSATSAPQRKLRFSVGKGDEALLLINRARVRRDYIPLRSNLLVRPSNTDIAADLLVVATDLGLFLGDNDRGITVNSHRALGDFDLQISERPGRQIRNLILFRLDDSCGRD
jgi:hypothetical protein